VGVVTVLQGSTGERLEAAKMGEREDMGAGGLSRCKKDVFSFPGRRKKTSL